MADDIVSKLTAEFGIVAIPSMGMGGPLNTYPGLISLSNLRRAFEIMDDVDGTEASLREAKDRGELKKQAAKAGKTQSQYVTDKVAEVRDMAHAKADVIYSYLYNFHFTKSAEDGHAGD